MRLFKCFSVSLLVLAGLTNLSMATTYDLTAEGSSWTVNGGIFNQVNPTNSSGTGVFDTYLSIQATGTEQGYNTDGTYEFDTKSGSRSLLLGAVPVLTIEGTEYREFCLDINQTTGNPIVPLTALKIHVESTGDLTGYPANFSTPIYDLGDNSVLMTYGTSGSGRADVALYVPSSLFGTDGSKYVYLYTAMADADDGFEEWGVGANSQPITTPEPATVGFLILGCLLFLRRMK